jgi:transposase
VADALGRPLAFYLTAGETAACKAYRSLVDLPEHAPDAPLADKRYDADAIRSDLADRTISAVIPGRLNRRLKIWHECHRHREFDDMLPRRQIAAC